MLPYCLYYKGEAELPPRFIDDFRKAVTSEGLLWRAEKFVCEEAAAQIDKKSPRNDIITWVDCFVGKWAPFEYEKIMSQYCKVAREL